MSYFIRNTKIPVFTAKIDESDMTLTLCFSITPKKILLTIVQAIMKIVNRIAAILFTHTIVSFDRFFNKSCIERLKVSIVIPSILKVPARVSVSAMYIV